LNFTEMFELRHYTVF